VSSPVDYRYDRPSWLDADGLALSTWHPTAGRGRTFFQGWADRSDVVAAGLLAVAQVARTRFSTPANMIQAVVAAADPIVTSDGERLRFESLSACCGVYARLDLLGDGIHGEVLRTGTTNIDVNLSLRDALIRVTRGEPLHLDIGTDHLHVQTLDADVVEERVDLPARWTRSLAEVPMALTPMERRFRLSAVDARRLLQGLPSTGSRGSLWLSPAGGTAVVAGRPEEGAVHLSGPERLRPLLPLLRIAAGVIVHGPDLADAEPGASSWKVELPGARLTMVLSPETSRAFSGEGGVLGALVDDDAMADAARVGDALAARQRASATTLAAATGLDPAAAASALRALGHLGRVGFDLVDGEHYWRALPLPDTTLEAMHPRLVDARALVAAGAVIIDGEEAVVRSGATAYRLTRDARTWRCTCAWAAQTGGSRGECKHALAAALGGGRTSHRGR
jgi:hypothetical protein